MKGNLHVVRGVESKLTIPAHLVDIHSDGVIWVKNSGPILGITDPVIKTKARESLKMKRYQEIPADAWTRLGDNTNGLWAGDDDAFSKHPAHLAEKAAAKARAEEDKFQIQIHLSTRGWGDYSSVEWSGDSRRPDSEIIAECRKKIAGSNDVDHPNITDAEIIESLTKARAKIGKPKITLMEPRDPNLCQYCGSYCDGDCGGKPGDETEEERDRKQAIREANYGIND